MIYEKARSQPMDYVDLPDQVHAGPNAYAVEVVGTCLSPEIEELAIVICDPDEMPQPGDFVAIWPKKGNRLPMIKRLTLALPPKPVWEDGLLVCEQINPEKRFNVPTNKIGAVHKAIHFSHHN